MSFLRPRTIRGQFMAALVLFEIIVVSIFTVLLVRQQNAELNQRLRRRLESQAFMVAAEGSLAADSHQTNALSAVVQSAAEAPSVSTAQITDLQGRTIASTDPNVLGKLVLSDKEKTYLRELDRPIIFAASSKQWEAVAPIRQGGHVRLLVWIYPNPSQDQRDLRSLVRITVLWALFVLAGCTLIAALLAQSTSRQLELLIRTASHLSQNPEDTDGFPLAVTAGNEVADLTEAFNRMVASIHEQRSGLNETLALLDSMLANAPIGFAFFDRKYRFVRVNQFLSDMNGYAFALHIGRTAAGILPPAAADRLEKCIETVFTNGQPVRNLEIAWEQESGRPRSWLVHLYPVHTDPGTTRWVGAILVDTTEQRRSEEALRRTEKLAAAGRLAASIAHEINNPLESVMNLLFLIRQEDLAPEAARFAELAQQEVTRVAEITQQTLRFYRQSTLPVEANVGELLDSVLTLHTGRIQSLQVELRRDYPGNLQLFCLAGELRQVFANLIGNALDAMTPAGGRLTVRARHIARHGMPGVAVTVADTGSGIAPSALRHIFEPFFTTKESTGTGLGLWVSDQIIRKHHAGARVRSCTAGPRAGTVFTVFFPADGLQRQPLPNDAAPQPAEPEAVL
ncbi:MAG TPA: ATP-binding protein [Acidobacteriaceae bacterium]|jgi:PAS domain S-box-containing protein|nr:ATP-binding protein [Acidobacteriaceae bacterium]